MTGTTRLRHPRLHGTATRARSPREVRTSAAPAAQLVRFALMGGVADGLYLGVVLLGSAGGADVQALNAVGTVASTVLADELHRRVTFRAAGRPTALAVHLAGSGTAAIGLAASTAALGVHQQVAPQGPSWGAAVVGLAVGSAVGLARFLVLRAVSTGTRATPRVRPVPGLAQRGRLRSAAGVLLVALALWPLGGAAATADGDPSPPTAGAAASAARMPSWPSAAAAGRSGRSSSTAPSPRGCRRRTTCGPACNPVRRSAGRRTAPSRPPASVRALLGGPGGVPSGGPAGEQLEGVLGRRSRLGGVDRQA